MDNATSSRQHDQRHFRHHLLEHLLIGLGIATAASGCCLPDVRDHCVEVDAGETCPDPALVLGELEGAESISGQAVFYPERRYAIDGEVYEESAACCYEVDYGTECHVPTGMGRPYLDEGNARHATMRRERDATALWSSRVVVHRRCPERAARWTRRGILEHAAIASLSRFALELMAHGGDADLVSSALRAARDEVAHARLSFGLARAFGAPPLAPDVFPFDETGVPIAATLTDLAIRTVHEAAVEETLGVVELAMEEAAATEPSEKKALAAILRDEREHALVAWRTLRWAVGRGGADVHQAVLEAFADARADLVHAQHDRSIATFDEVITPCVRTLSV